jgi:hypothetical protein
MVFDERFDVKTRQLFKSCLVLSWITRCFSSIWMVSLFSSIITIPYHEKRKLNFVTSCIPVYVRGELHETGNFFLDSARLLVSHVVQMFLVKESRSFFQEAVFLSL